MLSDRVYRLPLAREQLWQRIAVVDDYPRWWPWLRQFEAGPLEIGEVWRGTLQAPLPYAITCDIRFESVVEPELIAASLTGDLDGRARIELRGESWGTRVRVVSRLQARSRLIRLAAGAFPSLARQGHDWVLDTAAHQFGAASVDAPTLSLG